MNRKDFFTLYRKICGAAWRPRAQKKLVWAYDFAKLIHRLHKRDGGERYFEHPRRVALIILTQCERPTEKELALALMHDIIEDGILDPEILVPIFGGSIRSDIGVLSKTVSEYDRDGQFLGKRKKSLEEYYRLGADAPRMVRRVKIADRIDNLSDMGPWEAARKEKYLKETEEYILPIAAATDSNLHARLLHVFEEVRKSTRPLQ